MRSRTFSLSINLLAYITLVPLSPRCDVFYPSVICDIPSMTVVSVLNVHMHHVYHTLAFHFEGPLVQGEALARGLLRLLQVSHVSRRQAVRLQGR